MLWLQTLGAELFGFYSGDLLGPEFYVYSQLFIIIIQDQRGSRYVSYRDLCIGMHIVLYREVVDNTQP